MQWSLLDILHLVYTLQKTPGQSRYRTALLGTGHMPQPLPKAGKFQGHKMLEPSCQLHNMYLQGKLLQQVWQLHLRLDMSTQHRTGLTEQSGLEWRRICRLYMRHTLQPMSGHQPLQRSQLRMETAVLYLAGSSDPLDTRRHRM